MLPQGQSILHDAEEAEELSRLACETTKVGGDLRKARESEQGDGCVAKGGQVLRAVPRSDPALVLTERHVANPMDSILDAPMTAPVLEQNLRVRPFARDAGDGVLHFHGRAAAAQRGAFLATDLSQAGPVEMRRKTRAGLKMALGAAAVAFFGRASLRKMLLPLRFASGGKKRAEIRPRSPLSARADCL